MKHPYNPITPKRICKTFNSQTGHAPSLQFSILNPFPYESEQIFLKKIAVII